ncbi:MAG: glucosamine-6-phosphate deaminase, partial [Gaiellales bacterium]|nr:glucosamine-6-phosphate deaminase [Gaiellales bacterium]
MTLDPRMLNEWLAVPPEQLAERSPVPFLLLESREALHRRFADDLYAELEGARRDGVGVSLIVPLGPTGQYPILARRVNETGLVLDHATFFGMDEWLDWQGRPLPLEHPFSLEGAFQRDFIGLIEPGLRPRPANVIFPSPLALDNSAEEMARRGPVAATFGGVGFQGHIAFNEPPASRWTSVTAEQLRDSRTRVVPLAIDTIIAHAQRRVGGNTFAVPPLAVTLGMRELLSARRVRLYLDTGSWKQTILRILLFSE